MPQNNVMPALNIVFIASPGPLYGEETLRTNVLQVLKPIADEIFVITGNFPSSVSPDYKLHIRNIRYDNEKGSILTKVARHIALQFKIAYYLITVPRRFNIAIFYCAQTYLPAMMLAKLLKLKTINVATGTTSRLEMPNRYKIILSTINRVLERINYTLTDRIVMESEAFIAFMNFGKYKRKIVVNGGRYIDTSLFEKRKSIRNRRYLAGYIGRLALGKGIMNFIKAIPLIQREHSGANFLIGGDGPLLQIVRGEIESRAFSDKVEVPGWISHDKDLTSYFNELKLLVLASYSEGLPAIVQEAMACGVVVLATPVGGIPDLVKDGKTGFILQDDSSECIARNIIRVSEHPDLEKISQNARGLIEKEYAFNIISEKWKHLLIELVLGKQKKADAC